MHVNTIDEKHSLNISATPLTFPPTYRWMVMS